MREVAAPELEHHRARAQADVDRGLAQAVDDFAHSPGLGTRQRDQHSVDSFAPDAIDQVAQIAGDIAAAILAGAGAGVVGEDAGNTQALGRIIGKIRRQAARESPFADDRDVAPQSALMGPMRDAHVEHQPRGEQHGESETEPEERPNTG